MPSGDFEFETTAEDLGKRLDSVICHRATGISRARVQLLIKHHKVTVDDRVSKPSTQMRPGQTVRVQLSELDTLRPAEPQAEDAVGHRVELNFFPGHQILNDMAAAVVKFSRVHLVEGIVFMGFGGTDITVHGGDPAVGRHPV